MHAGMAAAAERGLGAFAREQADLTAGLPAGIATAGTIVAEADLLDLHGAGHRPSPAAAPAVQRGSRWSHSPKTPDGSLSMTDKPGADGRACLRVQMEGSSQSIGGVGGVGTVDGEQTGQRPKSGQCGITRQQSDSAAHRRALDRPRRPRRRSRGPRRPTPPSPVPARSCCCGWPATSPTTWESWTDLLSRSSGPS